MNFFGCFICRETGADDVTIKILFCGICHSDLHCARNEWGVTNYPIVPGYMMLILLYFITNIRFVFFCFYSTVLRSLIIVASNISGFCWMMFWWGVILIHTNWYDILEASIWVVEWWRPSNEIVDENYLLFLLIFVIIIIFLFKVCMDFYQRKQKSLYGWVFGLLVRGGPVSGLERPKTKFCNFKAVY